MDHRQSSRSILRQVDAIDGPFRGVVRFIAGQRGIHRKGSSLRRPPRQFFLFLRGCRQPWHAHRAARDGKPLGRPRAPGRQRPVGPNWFAPRAVVVILRQFVTRREHDVPVLPKHGDIGLRQRRFDDAESSQPIAAHAEIDRDGRILFARRKVDRQNGFVAFAFAGTGGCRGAVDPQPAHVLPTKPPGRVKRMDDSPQFCSR